MADNKDLNQRFDKLEARLDSMAVASPLSRVHLQGSDEIDLRELFMILWRGKWWIVGLLFYLRLLVFFMR